jgi:hypothetical protein
MWSKQEVVFLKENYIKGRPNWVLLLKNLNRSKKSIQIKASRLKLTQKNMGPWSNNEIKLLKKIYPTKKTNGLSAILKRSPSEIRRVATKLRIKKIIKEITHHVNHSFFRTWTNEMAWVLGWIVTDGSLSSGRHYTVEINSKDKPVLINITNLLKNTRPVYKGHGCFRIRVDSKFLYQDLINLGLHPNKSKDIKFPVVPKKFLPSFIRGLLDGDGSIYLINKKRFSLKFSSGSKDFLINLENSIRDIANVTYKNIQNNPRGNYLNYDLVYYSKEAFNILNELYKGSKRTTRLSRKYKIYNRWLKLSR